MQHEKYIQRCLTLARKGIGSTRPNPSVGSVIVVEGEIIGEGYTSLYGGNHAEVNAIESVVDKSLLCKATLYVTLEPCAHFGKTPPCSDLIIEHQIPTVVIGCVDANELVSGKGIQKLKGAGCEVIVGILEQECLYHHRRFFTVQQKKRPYIILKWAESKDGYIAPLQRNEQRPVWITNTISRQLAHKWRAEEHAVLVGTNTVLADNPILSVRDWYGENPIRIVIDRDLRLPKDLNVFKGAITTIIITALEEKNAENLVFELIDFSKNIAIQICEVLYKNNIQSVIIEGGTKTLQSFIDNNLWDEARVFTGDILIKEGMKRPVFSGKLISEELILQDILKIYVND